MRPPRRLFHRSSLTARAARGRRSPVLWASLAVGVPAALLAWFAVSLPGSGATAPDHLHADPGQVAVVGGDTLRLDGHIVRLTGVEAPNRGDSCKGGADCSGAARSALAGLVHDREVDCSLSGQDNQGRPYADCAADGLDLSRAIVASGWARAEQNHPMLAELELRARRQGAGLWAAGTSD